ncbi:unnamed protein product [Rotaria magnacalcarata]|uniref:Sodefrin-like factor n=1 Tax=Rotaria magnacalcarata TaxID=392030 RepID=A0A815LV19_9BILA|nr:unnamed protein product [Rotaria magnacalcarata]CAF1414853.1 unnamed protein product [Rotaria magnacalcarata]CAF2221779.1 unnamed protein product [Rotaria magnacalcarata]CAF4065746.1 unnamed protein product [Rotaria magnacalcarata]CAF4078044.1 unnamed protein product [Rotaria magnacalcarata]
MINLRSLILILVCLIVFCSGLRCTTNCSYKADLSREFFIDDTCTQISSAGRCEFNLNIWYTTGEYTVTFNADSSNYILGDRYHAMIQLPETDKMYVSYSIGHACKNHDDCARDFAVITAKTFLQRTPLDYAAVSNNLHPFFRLIL